MAKQRPKPWWLESGTEKCAICIQTYVYGTGYRCEVCAVSICSVCLEANDAGVLCRPCTHFEKED